MLRTSEVTKRRPSPTLPGARRPPGRTRRRGCGDPAPFACPLPGADAGGPRRRSQSTRAGPAPLAQLRRKGSTLPRPSFSPGFPRGTGPNPDGFLCVVLPARRQGERDRRVGMITASCPAARLRGRTAGWRSPGHGTWMWHPRGCCPPGNLGRVGAGGRREGGG